MKYEFEKVIDGILSYMDSEIFSGMNEWQDFAARVFIGRLVNNQEQIKNALINNGFLRTMSVIDSEGMVDVDTLLTDIKNEIERKGKISFNIPMFGKLTFKASDVDELHRHIGGSHESY